MARPLASGKKAVDLAGGARRVGSRIRRAPPPLPAKKLSAGEVREREAWVVATGITVFALALMVILLAGARWGGWSPAEHRVVIEQRS